MEALSSPEGKYLHSPALPEKGQLLRRGRPSRADGAPRCLHSQPASPLHRLPPAPRVPQPPARTLEPGAGTPSPPREPTPLSNPRTQPPESDRQGRLGSLLGGPARSCAGGSRPLPAASPQPAPPLERDLLGADQQGGRPLFPGQGGPAPARASGHGVPAARRAQNTLCAGGLRPRARTLCLDTPPPAASGAWAPCGWGA